MNKIHKLGAVALVALLMLALLCGCGDSEEGTGALLATPTTSTTVTTALREATTTTTEETTQPTTTEAPTTTTTTTATTTTKRTTTSTTSTTTTTTTTATIAPTATEHSTGHTVYITATGKKYHYNSHCNGGTYYESTYEQAIARGLTPCKKCVK